MSRGDPARYRWTVLALATLVQVGVSVLQLAPSALGPLMSRDLGLSRVQLGLLSSAIVGGMTVAMLPLGLLTDRYGVRKVMTLGVASMSFMVFLAARETAFGWLSLFFLLASFGGSSTLGGAKAVSAWFPGSYRNLALGIRQTGVLAGGLLAALILPPVAGLFGWRVALEAATGGTILTLLCFSLFFRESTLDSAGTQPRVPVGQIVRNRGFLTAACYSLVLNGAQWSTIAYLTLFLHEEVGLSAVLAGTFLSATQAGGIVGRIGWGGISDLLRRRKPILVSISLLAVVGCLAMTLVGPHTPLLVVGSLCAALGLSLLGWNGVYVSVIADSVPNRAAATAIGAGLTFTNVGSLAIPPSLRAGGRSQRLLPDLLA